MPSPNASASRNARRHSLATDSAAALRLVDAGLLLYRRGFVSFLLPTAILIVPLAMATGAAIISENFLLLLLLLLLWLPLPFMFLQSLSQITLNLQQGTPFNVWRTLWINPVRLIGMLIYSLGFQIVAQTASSTISFVCICPAMFGFVFLASAGSVGAGGGVFGAAVAVVGVVLGSILLLATYLFSVVLTGATLTSMVYAMQPFMQGEHTFGQALQESIALLGYRLGYNILVWIITATLFGVLVLVVSLAVGTLLPLPILFVLGSESPLAQGISAFAWVCGLILALPPLPIWMTLLYQEHQQARDGSDLREQVAQWQQSQLQVAGGPHNDAPVAPPA